MTATARPPGIDPRIAARRRAVALSGHRRRRRWWLLVAAVAVLVVVAWSLTRTSAFDVDAVEVEGAPPEAAAQVAEAIGPLEGTQLLEVDGEAVAERLRALPWVGEASVEVGWWGTVRVALTQRAPAAVVAGPDGAVAAVDGEGRVLGPPPPGADLVVVEGVGWAEPGAFLGAPVADALAVAGALEPGLRTRVEAVEAEPGGQVALRLRPSGRALLGAPDDVEAKVRSLQALFAQVVDWCLVSVDVRVPDQVAVRRDEACQAARGA